MAYVDRSRRLAGRYSSQSEQWRAGVRFLNIGKPVKVIHLGDHDPSGIDMTRDNNDRLEMFSEGSDIEVIRIALNMPQVQQYNPPPNPAKFQDPRAGEYIRRFGSESWELDALSPEVIDGLISSEIEQYVDFELWEEDKEREKKAKNKLTKLAKEWKE